MTQIQKDNLMLELFKLTPWPNTITSNDPTIKFFFLKFNVQIVQIYLHSQTPQYHMTHHQTILLKFDFGIVQIYPMAKHQSYFVG
jgi:hypothetical protein